MFAELVAPVLNEDFGEAVTVYVDGTPYALTGRVFRGTRAADDEDGQEGYAANGELTVPLAGVPGLTENITQGLRLIVDIAVTPGATATEKWVTGEIMATTGGEVTFAIKRMITEQNDSY
jgi:hypothetical protein